MMNKFNIWLYKHSDRLVGWIGIILCIFFILTSGFVAGTVVERNRDTTTPVVYTEAQCVKLAWIGGFASFKRDDGVSLEELLFTLREVYRGIKDPELALIDAEVAVEMGWYTNGNPGPAKANKAFAEVYMRCISGADRA